jgi:glycosyltransferase involved in cell wall biosynthesis
MRTVFLLVPSLSPAGPIKGAIALANGLVVTRPVTLVSVKPGLGADAYLDPRVNVRTLAGLRGGWRGKLLAYRHMLAAAGGRPGVASISMCFSADLINRFCGSQAYTCASVRGNLHENYRFDYGLPGTALAHAHMQILKGFDRVTALSGAMARQLTRHLGRPPEVIGNFVDEPALEHRRLAGGAVPGVRLVFVGSLSRRKQPGAAVRALAELDAGVSLDLVGDGPLRSEVEQTTMALGLGGRVRCRGHLADPLPVVAAADVLVLPSVSEGIARAALEALYLGVPCVMRDVDGNRELIEPGRNGALFSREADLARALREALAIAAAARGRPRQSLLPDLFTQKFAIQQYLQLI